MSGTALPSRFLQLTLEKLSSALPSKNFPLRKVHCVAAHKARISGLWLYAAIPGERRQGHSRACLNTHHSPLIDHNFPIFSLLLAVSAIFEVNYAPISDTPISSHIRLLCKHVYVPVVPARGWSEVARTSCSLLISPHLSSSHPISSQMSSQFFSTIFISSEHCPTFLISSKLFLAHPSSSVITSESFYWQREALLHKKRCTPKLLHREALRHRYVCTEKLFTHRQLLHMGTFYRQNLLHRETFYTEALVCTEW